MKHSCNRINFIMRDILVPVCLALVLLLVPLTASASGKEEKAEPLDPIKNSENFSALFYDNTNGLPTSEANAIAQTSDGFLWIGSYGGLVRYDGSTFERIDADEPLGGVTCLHVDSRDRLWIGTNDSGLAMMENGQFRFWHEEDGLTSVKLNSITEGPDGTIYVGTMSVAMISPDLELNVVEDPLIANTFIEQVRLGSDGVLYCTTNEDDYFTLRDGQVENYVSHENSAIEGVTCILPDEKDPSKQYIGTESSELYYGDITGDPGQLEKIDISPFFTVFDLNQVGDQIWLCCANGIGVLDNGKLHDFSMLPLNDRVCNMAVDYQGNLWFASNRQGVMKLAPNRFETITKRYQLPEIVVNTTCLYQNKLFIGTDTGLIVADQNERIASLPLTETRTASGTDLGSRDLIDLLEGIRIRSILKDSKGNLWISSWRGPGLVRYNGEKAVAFTEEDGMYSDQIRAVSEDPDGRICVAVTGGVNIIENDSVTGGFGKDEGITNIETLTVCCAPNGDIVLGSNGDGISVVSGGKVRRIGKYDGLSSGIVMRVKYDAQRDLFWIVTSKSLATMTRDYKVTMLDQFPYSNNFDLYESHNGDMWVLSSNGIYVLPADEILSGEEMKPVHYGRDNGLAYIPTSNSYSELTEGGDLYISGNAGVTKVNIDATYDTAGSFKKAVPFIDVDGERLYPDKTGSFKISSRAQKITIYPYVFNYSLADPQVIYRLDGVDSEEITASYSKLRPVTYTHLGGGTYTFRMKLKDEAGNVTKPLKVSLVKKKALHEYLWFNVLANLLAAAGIIALMRLYARQKMKKLEKKHREEAERERVNHELQTAAQIQGNTLPKTFPAYPERCEFDLYASMTPAREVGGDFYDFYLLDDDHLALLIADVSDKGIPAALFMMRAKTLIKDRLMITRDPAATMEYVNVQLSSQNTSMMFVTVWLAVLELSTGKGVACNAGHMNPGLYRAGGQFRLLEYPHDMFAGALAKARFHSHEFIMNAGDTLFVYTDGVTEAFNTEGEEFGEEGLVDSLNRNPDETPENLIRCVQDDVQQFANGAQQTDDITMLALKYNGAAEN